MHTLGAGAKRAQPSLRWPASPGPSAPAVWQAVQAFALCRQTPKAAVARKCTGAARGQRCVAFPLTQQERRAPAASAGQHSWRCAQLGLERAARPGEERGRPEQALHNAAAPRADPLAQCPSRAAAGAGESAAAAASSPCAAATRSGVPCRRRQGCKHPGVCWEGVFRLLNSKESRPLVPCSAPPSPESALGR